MISEVASASELSQLGVRVGSIMDSELVESLAVVATFDPDQAVPAEQRDAVAALCDRLADRDGCPEWMLKEGVRVPVLARMLRRGGPTELAGARGPIRPHETALQRVLDLAVRQQPLDLEVLDEQELVAALHVGRWCASAGSYAGLPGFAAAFDRERIEGRLALIETLRPLREITRDGVLGREVELARLHDYVGPAGGHVTLFDRPPLSVYGVGGVGKSTLMAQFLLDLAARPEPSAWAYLDLDRPSLSPYDPLTVVNDVIRQVGAQLPEIRRFLDYSGREGLEYQKGYGLESAGSESWRLVASQLANAVNAAANGRLVVVLDTYEEMQRADATQSHLDSDELSRMFFQLSEETTELRLVISGRAPEAMFPSSVGGALLLHVEAFRGAAARAVLQHLYARELDRLPQELPRTRLPLDEDLADEVVGAVGGSPLTLRLAARVLALEGVEGLDDATARAQALGRVTDEFVKGFLYHRILGHIRGVDRSHRQALREVAQASLALRHLDVGVVGDVVLPAIGRPDLDAGEMLSGLLVETALTDMQAGTARLRDELRGPALLALRYVEPDLVTDVHRRAAAYYDVHRELPDAAVELAYHRLALGDPDGLVGLDPLALPAVERSVGDLPPTSRDLVTGAVARPAALSEELATQASERATEVEARRALDAGDLDAAAQALKGQGLWSSTTRLFSLVARLEEARGNDEATLAAARSDLAAALRAEDPSRYCAAAIRLALIMERLSDGQGASVVLAEAAGQAWLAGHSLLRLEVQLNRIAIVDRSADSDWPVDRWLLELDARALLHRVDAAAVRSTTALVRLLAATLSRDEPSLVRDAVLSVGLGATTYSTHLRTLAEAMAEWDMDRADPGLIARSVGLTPGEPVTVESLTEAWFQAVAVQSSADTVPLLERAFSLEPPSSGVVAALRAIYLWWDLDPQRRLVVASGEAAPGDHFLDGPFDLADADAQQLLRTLNGAYPAATDLQVLAAQAGLDVGSLDSKTTRGLSTRSLLDQAANAGKLPDLIGVVLSDPKTAAFHDQLRNVVGTDWLDQHGIDPSRQD